MDKSANTATEAKEFSFTNSKLFGFLKGVVFLVLTVFALYCLGLVLFKVFFHSIDSTLEKENAIDIPHSYITETIDSKDLARPDLSAYPELSGIYLSGPFIKNIEVGEVEGADLDEYSQLKHQVTFDALYRNSQVNIYVPYTRSYTLSHDGSTWVGGIIYPNGDIVIKDPEEESTKATA